MMPLKLDSTYLRLRKDATAEPLVADETFWPRLINGELGTFVIVPRGTWHTARIRKPARMLFITRGEGTETRAAG